LRENGCSTRFFFTTKKEASQSLPTKADGGYPVRYTTHGSTNSFDYRVCSGLEHMRLHVYTRIQAHTRAKPVIGNSSTPVSSLSSININVLVFYFSMRKKKKERERERERGREEKEKERESWHSRILLHHIFYVRQNCLTIAWSINIQRFRVSFKTELPLFTIAEIQMSQFISFVYVREYASI